MKYFNFLIVCSLFSFYGIAQVNPIWVSQPNLPLKSIGDKVLTDKANNVYTLGKDSIYKQGGSYYFSPVIVKDDSNGNFIWKINNLSLNTKNMIIDNDDHIYLDTHKGFAIDSTGTITKIDTAGNIIWSNTPIIPSNIDYTYPIRGDIFTIDNNKNIYTKGYVIGYGGRSHACFAKFDSLGNFLWNYVDTSNVGYSNFIDLTCDTSGNIYVCGSNENISTGDSSVAILAKFNAAGLLQWEFKYKGNIGIKNNNEFEKLAIDNNQNIIVTGNEDWEVYTPYSKAFLMKIDPNMNILWTRYYSNGIPYPLCASISTCVYEDAVSVKVDSGNNIYMFGTFNPGSGNFMFIEKYTTTGNLLWKTIIDSTISNPNLYIYTFGDVLLNHHNNPVIVGGRAYTDSLNLRRTEFSTILLDPNGQIVFNALYPNSLLLSDICSVANDLNDNILVTGNISATNNMTILKYGNVTTSINQPDLPSYLQIYPNPTLDFFNVILPENINEAEINIINIFGQKVDKFYMASNSSQFSIRGIPGIYFITVTNKSNRWVSKIIKE